MNTNITKSFGLAIFLAIGVIAAMLALGLFSGNGGFRASKVGANFDASYAVTVSPATAGSVAQYTIAATGGANALTVGSIVTVTFNLSTTVPATIDPSSVTILADVLTGLPASALQLVNPTAISVTGQAVSITIPDMDQPSTSNGQQGIEAGSGVTITFSQGAGLVNPNRARAVDDAVVANRYTLTVNSNVTGVTTAATSSPYAITSYVVYTPLAAARGTTVDVTGAGFAPNCTTCNIRLNPQAATTPTTGSANSLIAFDGTGSIDANGAFTGSFVTTATTAGSQFVWVTDSAGGSTVSAAAFAQLAGATPRATSASPGSAVLVDLVDFNIGAGVEVDTGITSVGAAANTAANSPAASFVINASALSGDSLPLAPYIFIVPTATAIGTHVVTVYDDGTDNADTSQRSATFNLDVVSRTLVVTPSEAAPGQAITISGSNFSLAASTTIPQNSLTLSAGTAAATILNSGASDAITVNPDGTFLYTGIVPLDDDSVLTTGAKTFTATDNTLLVGVSSDFTLTARTVVAPATAAPGSSITVTGTGFTVGTNAQVTITSGGISLPTTIFPIAPDGSFSGIVVIPATQTVAVISILATDNSLTLVGTTANKTATTNLSITGGTLIVTPDNGSTGTAVVIEGASWPASQSVGALTIGGGSALIGGATTDELGNFTINTTVPAAALGGSLQPGATVVSVTVGTVSVSSAFTVPSPSVSVLPTSVPVGEEVVLTLTGFNALAAVTILNIGNATALPNPAPVMDSTGGGTAEIRVPALNPGMYNVTVNTGADFVGTTTITITAAVIDDTPEVTSTATVFATEITAENLEGVFFFNNDAAADDNPWTFFFPQEAFLEDNTYTDTTSGQILWVNFNEATTFQGTEYSAGWKLLVLQ